MLVSLRVEVAGEVATRVGAPHDVGLTDADFTADHASSSTIEPLLNLLLLGALSGRRTSRWSAAACGQVPSARPYLGHRVRLVRTAQARRRTASPQRL